MLPARPTTAPDRHVPSFMTGLWAGLAPLGILIGALLLTEAVTAAVRAALITQGFAVQHAALPLVFGIGFLAAVIGAVITVQRVFRRMRRWNEAGEVDGVRGSRWALIVTALVVVIPVFLAFVWPQSPAVAR